MIKGLIARVKNLFGFCCAKGCFNKSVFTVDIPSIKAKRNLCEEHTNKLVSVGRLKSIHINRKINFNRDGEQHDNS